MKILKKQVCLDTRTHTCINICYCVNVCMYVWICNLAPLNQNSWLRSYGWEWPSIKKKKKKVKAVSLWLLDELPLLSSSPNYKRQCYKEYRDNKTLFGSPFTHISVLISYILFPYFFLTHILSCLASKLGLVFSLKKQL